MGVLSFVTQRVIDDVKFKALFLHCCCLLYILCINFNDISCLNAFISFEKRDALEAINT